MSTPSPMVSISGDPSGFGLKIQCKHQGECDLIHGFRRQLSEFAIQPRSRQRTESLHVPNGAMIEKSKLR